VLALDADRRSAATCLDGPSVIFAGVGSGKTHTLVARVAHLIGSGKADPEQVLCMTSSNRAADEMSGRLVSVLGPEVDKRVWVSTFHSFCSSFLR